MEASLTQNPGGFEHDKGSAVALTCTAEGNPRPTKLSLKKGDQDIKSYDGSSDGSIAEGTYDVSYTHKIPSLALNNSGEYICEGENDNSGTKTDSATKTLTVVSDVVVSITASSTTPTVGTAFTITCTATGGF